MISYKETAIDRALNLTSIDLGDYVINPYKGCEYGCLYCYVRNNKNVKTKKQPWGSYVESRINIIEKLKDELKHKHLKRVLIGSTTEPFQPIENKYKLTREILKILTEHKIYYTILTRSPDILQTIDILKEGFCENIYFTVNHFDARLKALFENKAPDFAQRIEAINTLSSSNLPVVPYFSPILPFISGYKRFLEEISIVKRIEFECLNFNIPEFDSIIEVVKSIYPGFEKNYFKMRNDERYFIEVWDKIENEIFQLCKTKNISIKIHKHKYQSFFENSYK
ncbi:MAG: radical SAM protein [uncultured bacterium]|nr:MAG: radical SAM protein [uncultured bacterium]